MNRDLLLRRINLVWVTVLLALFGFVALYPVYFVIVTSFKTRPEYVTNRFGLPAALTLVNYVDIFRRFNFWQMLANSIFTTAGGVVLCTVLAIMLAYAVTKMRLPGKNYVFILVVSTLVLPVQTILFPLYQTLNDLKFVGQYWGLMVAYATYGLPLSVYLLAAYFKGIPDELLESARIDGANHWQILWRIMFPVGMPAIATVAIINTLWMFNDILLPLLILPESNRTTLMVHISLIKGTHDLSIPLLTAGLFLGMLPVLIVYLIGQRQLVKGMTAGAVK